MSKKTPIASLSEIEAEFEIEIDERGFSINCNIVNGNEDFEQDMVPSMVLHYIRMLCKETGVSFEKALRSSLGIREETIKAQAQA